MSRKKGEGEIGPQGQNLPLPKLRYTTMPANFVNVAPPGYTVPRSYGGIQLMELTLFRETEEPASRDHRARVFIGSPVRHFVRHSARTCP